MAKPLPLPVWDRQSGKLFSEWMDDHTPTYESEPRRSVTQWIKSQPLYDRLYAAYQNTRWSARQIEPFVRRYHLDLSEFEPVKYRSFAQFFDRRFRSGARKFPAAPEEMGAFAEARLNEGHGAHRRTLSAARMKASRRSCGLANP